MPSPLKGVWELVSDDEGKVLWMFSDTHFGYVSTRLGGRGYIGTYITEGNHLHMTRMLSTPTNPVTTLTVEFQRDGDTLTIKVIDEGAIVNVGHVDT